MTLNHPVSFLRKFICFSLMLLLSTSVFSFIPSSASHPKKSWSQRNQYFSPPYTIVKDSSSKNDFHYDTILTDQYKTKKIITSYTLTPDTVWQNPNVFTIRYDTTYHYDYAPVDPAYAYTGTIKMIKPFKFFRPSEVLNKPRVALVTCMEGGLYVLANYWWSSAWYSKYDKTKFHFFNDFGEWNQMDKVAHTFNAYFESCWTYDLFKWAGVKEKNAIWIGMLAGMAWQGSIEVNDGFQKKWGFSWGDMSANTAGVLLFGLQQYFWHDQRFQLKISAFPVNYSKYDDPEIKQRTDKLYGTSFTEILLKDYNAETFWLSVSPGSFIKNPKSKFPKWLEFSVGYGSKGMLGGYKNVWSKNDLGGDVDISHANPADLVDKTSIQRLRRFYFSFDIDWTKLPVKRHWAKGLMKVLNIVKIPAPAIEFNNNHSGSKVAWHWLKF